MKFADDVYLTPFGIWLKRQLTMLIEQVRPPDEKQKQSTTPPRQIAHEGKGALGGQDFLGSKNRAG